MKKTEQGHVVERGAVRLVEFERDCARKGWSEYVVICKIDLNASHLDSDNLEPVTFLRWANTVFQMHPTVH